ncbi:MAG: hypothetical protein AAFQ11_05055, partial [Pseudomonadota bacterium]
MTGARGTPGFQARSGQSGGNTTGPSGAKSRALQTRGAKAAKRRLAVPFERNELVPRLLGEYDAHLALLEDRLG